MYWLTDFEFILDSSRFNKTELQCLRSKKKETWHRSYDFHLALVSFYDINLQTLNAAKNIKEIIKDYQSMDSVQSTFARILFRKTSGNENEPPSPQYVVEINNNFLRSLKGCRLGVSIYLDSVSEKRRWGNWCTWGYKEQMLVYSKTQNGWMENFKTGNDDVTRSSFATVLGYNYFPKKYLKALNLILSKRSDIRLRFQLKIIAEPLPILPLPVLKLEEGSILKALFENESTKDVTIIAANGKRIKCHKLLLTAHSDVLDVMMSANMKEAETGVIQLDDMSEEGITQLIRYLYGMEISADDLESDTALDLFQASHKYKLSKLEEALGSLLLLRDEKWFAVDDALELYYYSKNLDEFEDLHKHMFQIMAGIPPKDLRNGAQFRKLKPEDALELTLKLMEC